MSVDDTVSFSVFRLVAMTISIAGNSLILFVILYNSKIKRKGTNLLFAQLAFADLIVGIGTGIRGISTIVFKSNNVTLFDKGLCLILGSPTVLGIHLSQTTMMAIAIDRFLCIQYPFLYRNLETHRFCFVRFLICLAYSLLGTFLPYVDYPHDELSELCSTGSSIPYWYAVYWTVFGTLFTLYIFVLYGVIYVLYKRSVSQRRVALQRHIFVTISIILVFYFSLCFIPNVILVVINLAAMSSSVYGHVSLLIAVGSAVNASVNVFIYGFKHPEIRGELRKVARTVCFSRLSTVISMTDSSKNYREATRS
ncbi:hypothetical protein QR680_008620 [Steinernema hermaphroditum]|uniref:G-protein coupled receptors family 1 profile domain-containing protein n=1 Tax=Steinernema hermaphroditum TaxID=289476 RepID=A0AA39IH95_9BILA|nr:hypothetical protein QR680_008620 [Steinernema hermaphroditum]